MLCDSDRSKKSVARAVCTTKCAGCICWGYFMMGISIHLMSVQTVKNLRRSCHYFASLKHTKPSHLPLERICVKGIRDSILYQVTQTKLGVGLATKMHHLLECCSLTQSKSHLRLVCGQIHGEWVFIFLPPPQACPRKIRPLSGVRGKIRRYR